MSLSENIRRQLLATFRAEQQEHVQVISQGLLRLEQANADADRSEILAEMFRAAHSLKGAARSVGVMAIENLGHALEDVLSLVRDDRLTLTPPLFDLCHQALDGIGLVIDRLDAGETGTPAEILRLIEGLEHICRTSGTPNLPLAESTVAPTETTVTLPGDKLDQLLNRLDQLLGAQPPPITPPKPALPTTPLRPTAGEDTLRVPVERVEALLAQLDDLWAVRLRAETHFRHLRSLSDNLAAQNTELVATENTSMPGRARQLLQQVEQTLNHLSRDFATDLTRLSLSVNDLQRAARQLRLLPFASLGILFERMVRDLARSQGKSVQLVLEGADLEMDRHILEQLKDPLTHLIRNAVAHGLETPAERVAAGKPDQGTITLSLSQSFEHSLITLADDGRGLDYVAIRKAAVQRGLVSAAAARQMSDADAQHLIFSPGFSTRQATDDLAGRGVGLDVVERNINALQGHVRVVSRPGTGTTFHLQVPLTLSSSRGLVVAAGGQHFLFPLQAIERMRWVKVGEMAQHQGRPILHEDGEAIALVWLADLLQLPGASSHRATAHQVILVQQAQQKLAIVVDELGDEHEIITKALGSPLHKVLGFAGATVLGTGEVCLVLQVPDLFHLAGHHDVVNAANERLTQPRQQAPQTILVVDDSLTVRTLEQSILETAGYRVVVAEHGQAALDHLEAGLEPDAIVADVAMPVMDGLTLTAQIKRNPRRRHIPVILVTSLESAADKTRGLAAGADAYIVKSRFDQGSWLAQLEGLL